MSIPQPVETVDEILQEVRRIKEGIARSCGYDVDAIIQYVKSHPVQTDGKLIEPPAATPQNTAVSTSNR